MSTIRLLTPDGGGAFERLRSAFAIDYVTTAHRKATGHGRGLVEPRALVGHRKHEPAVIARKLHPGWCIRCVHGTVLERLQYAEVDARLELRRKAPRAEHRVGFKGGSGRHFGNMGLERRRQTAVCQRRWEYSAGQVTQRSKCFVGLQADLFQKAFGLSWLGSHQLPRQPRGYR